MKNEIRWQWVFSIPLSVRRIGVGIVFIGIVMFGVQVVSAQEILDQENAPTWEGGTMNIQTSNEVGQSFQPSCYDLSRVDVDLIYQEGSTGSVTAKVLRNGLPIPGAHAQTFISQTGWVQLELDSVVSVTPGETLVLRLESDTHPLPLWKYAGDTYPRGTRLFFGSTQSGDFFFRTYGTSCPLAIAIKIDIKPGSFPNSINIKAYGQTPVAILTTDSTDNITTFDATSVDPATVLFGPTGTEAAPTHDALEDVDGDGDTDMLLLFDTQEIGINCGDTSATLTGATFDGEAIKGTDSIRTVEYK